jgi:hypothetical protein
MGNICHKEELPLQRKIISPDIKIASAVGSYEEIFHEFDIVNIFKYYNIQDFMYLFLNNFNRQEGISESYYYIFIEKKFIKNIQISEWIMNDEKAKSQVQDFHQKYFSIFFKGFKSYFKSIKNEKYKSENLPLVCFLPLGILGCSGRIDSKIELIFNLFCNYDQQLESSDELSYFIFSALSIPAGIFLFILKVLSDENEDYKTKIDKYDFTTIFDTYQIKDAINATAEYLKILFTPEKTSLSLDEFKALMTQNSDLHCIFSSSLVRKFLEKHNI